MNLILLEPQELIADEVILKDRRARHVREVIRPGVGDSLRVGVVNGPEGEGTVAALDPLRLRVRLGGPGPRVPSVDLVLAVPRPKVLGRVLQALGTLGVRRLDLVNAWRVEKSYFSSPRLREEALREALVIGAEQGATTWVPEVRVHPRLMAYLEHPPTDPVLRLIAHPRAATLLETAVPRGRTPCLVAVGPEGGWIPREVETFERQGFTPVRLGEAVLRVEQAVTVLLGQLSLLERLAP